MISFLQREPPSTPQMARREQRLQELREKRRKELVAKERAAAEVMVVEWLVWLGKMNPPNT